MIFPVRTKRASAVALGDDNSASPPAGISWQRNLVSVWLAQVLSLMGFAFAMSFGAYYIQSLGVTDPKAVKIWNGIYQAAGPLTFAIMSPVWGALGDRYGRRLMLLRANVAATVIVFLMGYVTSVEQLIVLRLFQGIFTGTVSASLTLVATTTPKERYGIALGSLQTAMVVGWMAGSSVGGLLADRFGYAPTIRLGSILLLGSALLILFTVKEEFVPPARPARRERRPSPLLHFEGTLPILLLFFFVALARRFDGTVLPLFIQELNGGRLEGSATLVGNLTAVCSVAAALSCLGGGWLLDRVRPVSLVMLSALIGGILAALQFFVDGFLGLGVLRFSMAVAMGGMEPAFQVWLTQCTSSERRGRLMGYSVSAKSVGWILAALSSSFLAGEFGIRPVFLVEGVLLLAMIPITFSAGRVTAPAPQPELVPAE